VHRIRRVGVIKTATTVAVLYALAIAIFAIPVALLAVLIMLGLAALAAAVPFVRRRVLARRLA